jgi:hypothetical protein
MIDEAFILMAPSESVKQSACNPGCGSSRHFALPNAYFARIFHFGFPGTAEYTPNCLGLMLTFLRTALSAPPPVILRQGKTRATDWRAGCGKKV